MKTLLLALSLIVTAAASAEWRTVMTTDNVVWGAYPRASSVALDLLRRDAGGDRIVRVPGTQDPAVETAAQLAYDNASGSLFVFWRHGQEIRVMRHARDRWSDPITVAAGEALDGLQVVTTRNADTTFLHGVWWSGQTAEYALLAFDDDELLSQSVTSLDELSGVTAASTIEDTGDADHPPLTLARAGQHVSIAYGSGHSTAITLVNAKPEKVGGNARIWRPVGRSGRRTDPSYFTSTTSAAVQSFILEGRVVLYTPGTEFRYVVLENGRWTPVQSLALDADLTGDMVLREIRRFVLELSLENDPEAE